MCYMLVINFFVMVSHFLPLFLLTWNVWRWDCATFKTFLHSFDLLASFLFRVVANNSTIGSSFWSHYIARRPSNAFASPSSSWYSERRTKTKLFHINFNGLSRVVNEKNTFPRPEAKDERKQFLFSDVEVASGKKCAAKCFRLFRFYVHADERIKGVFLNHSYVP